VGKEQTTEEDQKEMEVKPLASTQQWILEWPEIDLSKRTM
jgi:hypothetical protein